MPDQRFELRSEEVQEILSHIPHWIIRWGITVVFLTVLMLVAVAWVIKYPDIVTARITVTTQKPPIGILSSSSGTLRLFVKDNQKVVKDQYLAAIAIQDSMPNIFDFKRQLESFRRIASLPEDDNQADTSELDRLQVDYTGFLESYFKNRYFNQANYQADKIKTVLSQILYRKDLNRKLNYKKRILAEEVAIDEKKFKNDRALVSKSLISEDEAAKSHSVYLQQKYAFEEAKSEIIDNKILLIEHQKTALEFINQLAQWEDKFLIKAPIDGTVSFFKFWSDGQNVVEGDEVMAIVPESRDIIGKLMLGQAGAGKVKTGQRVNIKFDSYPYTEYGIVEGRVAAISIAAREGGYLVDVAIPHGLLTSYSKTINFKQGMQGTADIVTEDLRLLQRIFYKFKYFFKSTLD